MKDNFHDRLEEMLWDYHSELWSIKQQDDYMSQMDTANDIQKIIDELATALTHLIETEKIAEIQKVINQMDTNKTDYADTYHYLIDRIKELQRGIDNE